MFAILANKFTRSWVNIKIKKRTSKWLCTSSKDFFIEILNHFQNGGGVERNGHCLGRFYLTMFLSFSVDYLSCIIVCHHITVIMLMK